MGTISKTADQLAPGDVLVTAGGDRLRITGEVRESRSNPGYHACEVDLGLLLVHSEEGADPVDVLVEDEPAPKAEPTPVRLPEGPDDRVEAGMSLPLVISEEVYGDAVLLLDQDDIDLAVRLGYGTTAREVLAALVEGEDGREEDFDSVLADLVVPSEQQVSERSATLDESAMLHYARRQQGQEGSR